MKMSRVFFAAQEQGGQVLQVFYTRPATPAILSDFDELTALDVARAEDALRQFRFQWLGRFRNYRRCKVWQGTARHGVAGQGSVRQGGQWPTL